MRRLLLLSLLSISFTTTAQNLLQEDFDNWTEGRDPTPGFHNMGDYEENIREYGPNPNGANALLWKSTPVLGDDSNGGFYTDFHPIDHLKEYRFSVWFKRTGIQSGQSFMGPYAYNNRLLTLNGAIDNNPLFMNYTFTDMDQWFLAVAYVRPSDHTGTENKGRLYSASGEEIGMLKDYKFSMYAVACMLRAFLFYDTTVTNNQFLYAPRMEEVNGLEPTIEELLNSGIPTALTFSYDQAGNQKLRAAPTESGRSAITRSAALPLLVDTDAQLSSDDLELLVSGETPLDILEELDQSIRITPNPTAGQLYISWEERFRGVVVNVAANDLLGRAVPIAHVSGTIEASADLSGHPSGIYVLTFYLNDGRQIEKQIIKE